MPSNQPFQRVRIYLNERDQSEGQPLYLAVLELLRREGATGATATRGLSGFGPRHRLRTAGLADMSAVPIVIEWVDRIDRIAQALPALDDLLPDALITVEDLQIYRALLRSSGPFGERTVGEMMARDVASGGLAMPLREAAELMLARRQPLLPVLSEREAVAGICGFADLMRRFNLALPMRIFEALSADERAAVLDRLQGRTVAEAMTGDPRTVYTESSVPQAISPLLEWGLDMLPVIDRGGRLAGLFGIEHALRAALHRHDPPPEAGAGAESAGGEHAAPPASNVRDAEPPTPVGLVMQRAVPSIPASTPLPDVLARALAAPDSFLVVVEDGRPVGTLTDVRLAQQLDEPVRSLWLAALREPDAPLAPLPEPAVAGHTAGSLADRPAPLIETQATLDTAIQTMLDGGHDRLVVVDTDGRLSGLLARRVVLRALIQESAA